jgi:hypothetical protein
MFVWNRPNCINRPHCLCLFETYQTVLTALTVYVCLKQTKLYLEIIYYKLNETDGIKIITKLNITF